MQTELHMNTSKSLEQSDLQIQLDRIEQKLDKLLSSNHSHSDIDLSEMLDVCDVAKICKVTPRSVYNWVWAGKIPHFKANGRLLFRQEDLRKFLLQKKHST